MNALFFRFKRVLGSVFFGVGACCFLGNCGGSSGSGGQAQGGGVFQAAAAPAASAPVSISSPAASSCDTVSGGLAPTIICGGAVTAPPTGASQCAGTGSGGAKGTVIYHGGAVLGCAEVIAICLNAPCSTYGVDAAGTNHNETPCNFWNRLDQSSAIHITDEYVGQTSENRYVCTNDIEVDNVPTGGLSDQQMLSIITANLHGTGLSTVYNLFMTSAQLNEKGACAYHTAAQISVSGQQSLLVYTANADCGTEDDMNHEMFESITDPQADGSGWIQAGAPPGGGEVADLCTKEDQTTVSGIPYKLQGIWSNAQNVCVHAGP